MTASVSHTEAVFYFCFLACLYICLSSAVGRSRPWYSFIWRRITPQPQLYTSTYRTMASAICMLYSSMFKPFVSNLNTSLYVTVGTVEHSTTVEHPIEQALFIFVFAVSKSIAMKSNILPSLRVQFGHIFLFLDFTPEFNNHTGDCYW